MTHVIKNYPKVDAEMVRRFREIPCATAYEAAGQRGMMDPAIRPIYPTAKICGPALTVSCHVGDNLMIHKAVAIAQPGDVLVVTIRSDARSGAWGEILTTAAQARGVTGLVIDGGVRDVEANEKKRFPIFSRGIAVGATMKKNLGTINHPIVCGDVEVRPGDLVLADRDGVVIVPREKCEQILSESVAREEREKVLMEKLGEGNTTLELLGLDPILADLGLTEE